jgi:hypothetical protein
VAKNRCESAKPVTKMSRKSAENYQKVQKMIRFVREFTWMIQLGLVHLAHPAILSKQTQFRQARDCHGPSGLAMTCTTLPLYTFMARCAKQTQFHPEGVEQSPAARDWHDLGGKTKPISACRRARGEER